MNKSLFDYLEDMGYEIISSTSAIVKINGTSFDVSSLTQIFGLSAEETAKEIDYFVKNHFFIKKEESEK